MLNDCSRELVSSFIFFSLLRYNLKSETIDFLTAIYYLYIEEDGIEESDNAARNVESARRADKFAKLAIENRSTLSIADGGWRRLL